MPPQCSQAHRKSGEWFQTIFLTLPRSGSQRNGFAIVESRRLQRSHSRQRFAEIRKSVTAPGESLRVHVAILPAMLAAGFGMVNDPVLSLAKRFHERTM